MPGATVTATARSWLQAPFKAPAACTIRIAIASGGGNHDWSVTAGESWASLDELISDWNTALAGAATVAIVPDVSLCRGYVVITTGTGATYTLTWSHAGDGSAIRDRLGSTGTVTAHASGTAAWSGAVLGAFYSWVGFGLVRARSGITTAAALRMTNGTIVSQHSRDSSTDPTEMDLVLRWGLPPNGLGLHRMAGHIAFETFIADLYDADTPHDTIAVYHLSGGASAERWLVRLADDRASIRPSCTLQPHLLFEVTLRADCIEAPI